MGKITKKQAMTHSEVRIFMVRDCDSSTLWLMASKPEMTEHGTWSVEQTPRNELGTGGYYMVLSRTMAKLLGMPDIAEGEYAQLRITVEAMKYDRNHNLII